MMNEDGGDELGSGNGCCSWLRIKKEKKKSSRVQNPNITVASSSEPHTVPRSEAGTMLISTEVLRSITNNFSEENILGRGGSGTVYKGELPNGITIAVKRMKPGAIVGKVASEFEAEMAVMRTARHQNLVLLLGYCLDGNEKLIVYEYMAQGTLSRYIFNWLDEGLEPLAWNKRLIIALDVARGVEYLHHLGRQCFIHRDLKPTNILLRNDMRAKVADFGLVCLAPDEKASLEAKFAGTFGYMAP